MKREDVPEFVFLGFIPADNKPEGFLWFDELGAAQWLATAEGTSLKKREVYRLPMDQAVRMALVPPVKPALIEETPDGTQPA